MREKESDDGEKLRVASKYFVLLPFLSSVYRVVNNVRITIRDTISLLCGETWHSFTLKGLNAGTWRRCFQSLRG